jgi:hypothetical protein
MIQSLITALEARVAALKVEATALIAKGEVDAAKLKTAFAEELAALVAELQKVLGDF